MSQWIKCNNLELQLGFWSGFIMVATIAVGLFTNCFTTLWFFSASLAASVVSFMCVIAVVIVGSPSHSHIASGYRNMVPKFVGAFQERVKEIGAARKSPRSHENPPIIMNRNVTTTLQNLMDLVFRDLIEPILQDVTAPGISSTAAIKSDAWEALHKFYCKISNIDPVQFVSQDVVIRLTRHLEKIRLAKTIPENSKDRMISFNLSSFLRSPRAELDLLRKLCDVMIVNLFPRSYVDCFILRHALRELLTCRVLQPGIDSLCDPDTINQQLVLHLRLHQMMKKSYTCAASYEDFVCLIEECDELNELEQIRYNLATEITQATAIASVKRAKGMEPEQEFTSLGPNKVDLLQARNMKRYIKQLTYAKLQCERRLRLLGAPLGDTASRSAASTSSFSDEMIPSFKTVMRNNGLRKQLEHYLAQQGEAHVGLLKFWVATQELRRLDRKSALVSAAQMFYTYINGPNQIIKLEKNLVKGMEGFITGDKGPESFFQAQDQVWKLLEEKHYPSFLVVLTCQMTGRQANNGDTDASTDPPGERPTTWKVNQWIADECEDTGVIEWSEQTALAKSRMEQLDSRLVIKLQAMSSLRSVAPSDSPLVITLEKEIECLQSERREVESWLNQAESWAAHMGQWKATVVLPQNQDDKENVRFPIELRLEDEAVMMATTSAPTSRKRVAMSWTVCRQVAEFYALQTKLSTQSSWLKSSQLPSVSGKSLFGKLNDRFYLEKAQDKLQSFLDLVMADDRLNKSEALFTFLHNTPPCLRQADAISSSSVSSEAPKKTGRFFLATLFKGDTPRESDDDVDQDGNGGSTVSAAAPADEVDSLFQSPFSDDARDGIAEPIYHLISEVFELRGVFGWLRRTLVTFVQITYGRTINRQLRDVVSSVFTDQAVLGYVQLLVKTWWPEGNLLPPAPLRTAEEKRRTKSEARELLVSNIPEVFSQLLGHKNARRGTLKVFDALQDQRLNKQLFYELLEVIIADGFPELSEL